MISSGTPYFAVDLLEDGLVFDHIRVRPGDGPAGQVVPVEGLPQCRGQGSRFVCPAADQAFQLPGHRFRFEKDLRTGKKRLHRLSIETVGRQPFGKRRPVGGGRKGRADHDPDQINGCDPDPDADMPKGPTDLFREELAAFGGAWYPSLPWTFLVTRLSFGESVSTVCRKNPRLFRPGRDCTGYCGDFARYFGSSPVISMIGPSTRSRWVPLSSR